MLFYLSIYNSFLVTESKLGKDILALLLDLNSLSSALLLTEGRAVVLQVPLLEGGRVNLDNTVLDKGVGSDKVIVTGIVDNVNYLCLPGGTHGLPVEVTLVVT